MKSTHKCPHSAEFFEDSADMKGFSNSYCTDECARSITLTNGSWLCCDVVAALCGSKSNAQLDVMLTPVTEVE